MSSRLAAASLQKKVSLSLLSVMTVLGVLSYAILHAVVAPAFDDLEQDAARTNLIRAEKAIASELETVDRVAIDWGPWDDAYHYVLEQNPTFERSNLLTATQVDLHLDLMSFFRSDGALKWGQLLVDDQPTDIARLGIFDLGSESRRFLLTHAATDNIIAGIIGTELGPMLVISRPILRTDSSGPIAGTIVFGRLLSDELLQLMREKTEVRFNWHLVDDDRHGDEVADLLADDAVDESHQVESGAIRSLGILRDVFGVPLLVLHAEMPRHISALGTQTLNAALVLLGAATLIVTLVIVVLLRGMIVAPLRQLSAHIVSIRESNDLSKRLGWSRTDEIGALARKFDVMTDELDDANKQLLEQSFKAGKADTAAEVLHNIRNAMTPVINGVDRLGTMCGVTDTLKVPEAVAQLQDPDCPVERKDKLLQYVESAYEHIVASHQEGRNDLQTVSRQARQVEAILADQEQHAKACPVVERLPLADVLDEAVLVIPKRKQPQVDVEVQSGIGQFAVKGHRVGLLQVLGNLILNAYEAINRSDAGAGRIAVSASNERVGDTDMVRVTVSDTGCGFDSEGRKKIFQRGFSSKQGHMSGLGLHWCANALAGMGGRIHAESDGEGRGARFHVLLPAAQGGSV